MPDRYTLPRSVSGTPPAATDLVMLVPPEDDAEPKARTLQEVGSTFATPRAGVTRLLYWDPSETEFRFSVSGEYRLAAVNLNGETIQVSQRVVIWVECTDTNAVFELVDSADLANAGGLSGPHRIIDNFVVLRATVSKDTPGYVVRMTGNRGSTPEPFQLRWIIHGAWLVSSDADSIGIESLKAAVQSAVEAEAFPPPYSTTRVWSPGEYFYLDNAVWRCVQHTIGVAVSNVSTSGHFEKVLDGAASRSDDIDARVAEWAEDRDDAPLIPDSKRTQTIDPDRLPTIPEDLLPEPPEQLELGIAARTNSTIDLSHGTQTITLPGASPTEAGLLRGQEQAKLTGLVRNRWVGNVTGGVNFLDGDVVWQHVGRRLVIARCKRDHQTSNGRKPLDLAFSGPTYWDIVFDITLPTIHTASEIVTLLTALTEDDRLSYNALKDKPTLADPGRLHMWLRHDGRIAYGFGGETSVESDADGTVIESTDQVPFTPFHNRHEWVQGVTFYPENLVRHNSIRYICLVEHVSTASNAPGTGTGSATIWEAW